MKLIESTTRTTCLYDITDLIKSQTEFTVWVTAGGRSWEIRDKGSELTGLDFLLHAASCIAEEVLQITGRRETSTVEQETGIGLKLLAALGVRNGITLIAMDGIACGERMFYNYFLSSKLLPEFLTCAGQDSEDGQSQEMLYTCNHFWVLKGMIQNETQIQFLRNKKIRSARFSDCCAFAFCYFQI